MGGTCKGGPAGESTKPAVVVRENGGDSGLLAHEFRDRDGIRFGRGSPRERSMVLVVPAVKEG